MEKLADKIVNEDLSVRGAEAAAALSDGKPKKPAKPSAGKRQDHLAEIADRLGDRLDTRVKITLGASKGTIVIDFATVGDLNRILGELGQDPFASR
jgi:ParB family chromosome partitioning protein